MTVTTDPQAALKGLYFGALYGLCRAADLEFQDQTGNDLPHTYREELQKGLASLASGAVALPEPWQAGFYFNDGLFRLAAVYERGLKLVVGRRSKGNVGDLRACAIAKGLISDTQFRTLDDVREAVNGLKHDYDGLLRRGRIINWEEAVTAACEGEELLRLALKVTDDQRDR